MGAELWYYETPWHARPHVALKSLQDRFVRENYDLPTLLPQHLTEARESVADAEREGDPYELLDMYRTKLQYLERLCSQPIPNTSDAQIEAIRQIYSDSGQGVGNVLDVVGMSQQRAVRAAQQLTEQETARLVGAIQPTIAQASKSVETIYEELGRGECICFPIYDNDKPAGWYFIGKTID